MAKRLKSVFTDDMDHCFITGSSDIERHHIFGGYSSKSRQYSEEDGFIIPLARHLHPNGAQASEEGRKLDIQLKQMAQRYYEEHYGTREQFIQRYGKSWM